MISCSTRQNSVTASLRLAASCRHHTSTQLIGNVGQTPQVGRSEAMGRKAMGERRPLEPTALAASIFRRLIG